MARPSPLFRVDPGWIWIAVGLVTVFVATVVPAQRRLEQDRAELRRLQAAERRTYELLEAHDQFLSDLREGQPSILRRLAAASLNRMPEGDEAWILADSIDQNPIAWIDSTIPVEPTPPPGRRSLLERLVGGRVGLWSTAFGVFCLFVGLVVGPGTLSPTRRRDEGPAWPTAEGPAAALTTLERGSMLVEPPHDAGAEDEAAIGSEDLRRWAPRTELPSDATIGVTSDVAIDESSDPALAAGPIAMPALFEAEPPAAVVTEDATTEPLDGEGELGDQAEASAWSEEVEHDPSLVHQFAEDANTDHEVEAVVRFDARPVVGANAPTSTGLIAADHALVVISTASSEPSAEMLEDRATSEEFVAPGDSSLAVLKPAANAMASTEVSPAESTRGTTVRSLLSLGSAPGLGAQTSYVGWSEEAAVAPLDLLGSSLAVDGGASPPAPSDAPMGSSGETLVGAGVGVAQEEEREELDGDVEDEGEFEDEKEEEDDDESEAGIEGELDAESALEDEVEEASEEDLDDEMDEDEGALEDAEPPIIELHVDPADADPVNAGEPLDPPWRDEADRR